MFNFLETLEPPAELVYFVRQHVVTAGLYDPSEKPHLKVVPVLVQPVDDSFDPVEAPRAAVTRDISPTRVGLVHSTPFRQNRLVLQMPLADEMVYLVVEVQWHMDLGPFLYSGASYVAKLDRLPPYEPSSLEVRHAKSWRGHILVVDDSSISAQMVQANLEHAGYQVTTASDGREAWTKAREQQFDLVLTDEQMPLMTGTELCRLLRIHALYRDTPLVLFTTKGELPSTKGFEEELNLVSTVYKSFSPKDIVATIEAAFSSRKLATG